MSTSVRTEHVPVHARIDRGWATAMCVEIRDGYRTCCCASARRAPTGNERTLDARSAGSLGHRARRVTRARAAGFARPHASTTRSPSPPRARSRRSSPHRGSSVQGDPEILVGPPRSHARWRRCGSRAARFAWATRRTRPRSDSRRPPRSSSPTRPARSPLRPRRTATPSPSPRTFPPSSAGGRWRWRSAARFPPRPRPPTAPPPPSRGIPTRLVSPPSIAQVASSSTPTPPPRAPRALRRPRSATPSTPARERSRGDPARRRHTRRRRRERRLRLVPRSRRA